MKNLNSRLMLVLAGLFAGVTTAQAAIPAIVGTTLATVQTDGLAMVDLIWPVVVTFFGAIFLIKMFKRSASKI